MDIITSVAELRAKLRAEGQVACVPTMGNLHEGHLQLMRRARALAPCVVATLFVNRLQFSPTEDFNKYPRSFESDCAKLEQEGVQVVFAPDEHEMYPEPQGFFIAPPVYADTLEGASRPGFFRGVATVVLKLFNIVQPQFAVFGKKDYQQLIVVRDMVRQLALPLAIVAAETARAPDGLALSSRNGYLAANERTEAPRLYRTLSHVAAHLSAARNSARLEEAAGDELRAHGWSPDYVAVRRQSDLQMPTVEDRELVVLGAAKLGGTRLIDNVEVSL
jgi:pantoate--beta-alanine ligase